MSKEQKGRYSVGYGRPPKHSQFKPGQSGNAKGRPKGTLNLATILNRALHEQVVVTEKGRRKVTTKLELAIAKMIDKSVAGDPVALRQLIPLVNYAEERSPTPDPEREFSHDDQRVLQSVLKRLMSASKGDLNGENNS